MQAKLLQHFVDYDAHYFVNGTNAKLNYGNAHIFEFEICQMYDKDQSLLIRRKASTHDGLKQHDNKEHHKWCQSYFDSDENNNEKKTKEMKPT
eukprot:3374989-Pleurochrysis_carterae.AAC.3